MLTYLIDFLHSLLASIKAARPELLPDRKVTGLPISQEMPSNYFDKDIESIEDIGEPAKASVFSLSNVDPTNWYITHADTTKCPLF